MSEPLRTGVVGFGYWGVNQARNVADSSQTHLAAVIDRDDERRALAAARHPATPRYADLATAVEQADLEALVVATPAGTHAEVTAAALEHGLHVLVEKPLAMASDDAQELVALATRRERHLMVGHTFLYSSPVRHLRSIIDAGELGDLRYLAFQRLSLGTIRPDCDVLWNLAPHDVSIALYLLGQPPVEASATGFSFLQSGIDDVVFGSLRFADGIGAGLQFSWLDPLKVRRLTVVGTEKMAVYDDVSPDRKIEIFDAGVVDPEFSSLAEWQWQTRAGDIVTRKIDMWEPLRLQIDSFAELCRNGTPVPTDGQHGVEVVRVLEALAESTRLRGGPVPIPEGAT